MFTAQGDMRQVRQMNKQESKQRITWKKGGTSDAFVLKSIFLEMSSNLHKVHKLSMQETWFLSCFQGLGSAEHDER